MVERLWGYWKEAHELCGVALVSQSEVFFNDILVRMGEPHRRYHTLDHVLDVCDVFTKLCQDNSRITDRGEALFALFVHDVVYEIGATDNEIRSADYGRERLAALQLTEQSINVVSEIVELTASHRYAGDNEAIRASLDADMAILGSPPLRYREYITLLRDEYRQVDDEAWRQGRSRFLAATLASPIYLTESAMRSFESLARENMQAELQALSELGQ